ncbi:MAG: ABC transporter permease [Austwickia sp.]|jgi:putative ABC transport system permease protein|nr:MAG: ABC transporter permease [Austwickia sp.]
MLTQPRRLISAAVAVLLGVAFVAAALGIGGALRATIERAAGASVGDAAVVVTPQPAGAGGSGDAVPGSYVESLRTVQGVADVRPLVNTVLPQELSGQVAPAAAQSIPDPASGGGTLRSGRLPAAPGEVAVNPAMAETRRVAIGQELRFQAPPASGQAQAQTAAPSSRPARVVGIIQPGPGADRAGLPTVYGANADLLAWAGRPAAGAYDDVLVSAAPGADPAALVAAARALPGASAVTVRTGPDEIAARVSDMDRDSGAITGLFLAFAAISVLVSSLVIANTFAIVVAQQVRALALLRCVGATRRQVFRGVLRDAWLMSLAASAAGLALGYAVVALLVRLSQGTAMPLAGVAVTPAGVAVPLLVGVLVTLAAAAVPARRATGVAPLAALRPEVGLGETRRAGMVRTAFGAVLTLLGTGALVLGAMHHQLLLGLAGGAASLVGIVLLGQLLTPALARALGVLPARAAGLPGRLAVDNARRNPARAAATASALFVGVTLITLMSVGAASAQRSVTAELDRHMPIDAVVHAPAGLTDQARDKVARTQGVAAVGHAQTAQVAMASGGRRLSESTLLGLGEGTAATVRSQAFAGVTDGVLLLGEQAGVADGATVTLGDAGRTVEVRALVRGDASPVTTLATLQRALGDRPATPAAEQYWVRFADGVDQVAATERIREAVAGQRGVQVDGAAAQRAELDQVLAVLLYVVTGLLGVAVVIALVGVGNTLGLSVLERTRENGLLRALGVTRRQVRGMLGIEALVLAAVGTVLGIACGIGYGVAGSHALLGRSLDVLVAVPWDRLALVAGVALAAGWLASVVPGRRAAKVPPSAALATE